MKTISIKVLGRVQGVWYRASTKEEALKHGLKGIVRNEPDGSVYIVATGEENTLRKFIAWCREGPKYARVEDVIVSEQEFIDFQDFIIQR